MGIVWAQGRLAAGQDGPHTQPPAPPPLLGNARSTPHCMTPGVSLILRLPLEKHKNYQGSCPAGSLIWKGSQAPSKQKPLPFPTNIVRPSCLDFSLGPSHHCLLAPAGTADPSHLWPSGSLLLQPATCPSHVSLPALGVSSFRGLSSALAWNSIRTSGLEELSQPRGLLQGALHQSLSPASPGPVFASTCQPLGSALSEYDSQGGDVAETATQFKLHFICWASVPSPETGGDAC